MKRVILVAALALTLGGCFQTTTPAPPVVVAPPLPPPAPNLTPIEEKIIDIREAVLKGCNFVPVASFFTQLVTSNGLVGSVFDYASAICKVALAPTPRAAGLRTTVRVYPGTVDGVRVVGRFAR